MIDLTRHKTCIFGIQESGKTFWTKLMYRKFKKPIVFSVNKDDGWEHLKGIYVWKVEKEANVKHEFKLFIEKCREWAEKGLIDLIIIDEADYFIQYNGDLTPEMQDLTLNHRHFNNGKGVALWFVTRRPQDIPTKIVESSKHLIIFKLEGKNAIDRFYDIHPELPGLIEKIDFEKHNFVHKELGKAPYIHKPLSGKLSYEDTIKDQSKVSLP